jgi:hypothetical protein
MSESESTIFINVGSSFPRALRIELPGYNASLVLTVIGVVDSTTALPPSGGVSTLVGSGNPGDGRQCAFPFVYNGQTYNSCTCDGPLSDFWCATTDNLNRDVQWGFCNTTMFDADATSCEDRNNGALAERTSGFEGSVFEGYETAKPNQAGTKTSAGSNSVATLLSASLGAALLVVAIVVTVMRKRHQR